MISEPDRSRMETLKANLGRSPRVRLANLPTPFESCPRLSHHLGGPVIWIKRDDLTGLALGGNKTRMLEYVLADALRDNADVVVAGAAVQSNYCRQLAAACAKLGLECHLILRGVTGQESDVQGGLLINLLTGARVEVVEAESWVDHGRRVRERADQLRRAGRNVFVGRCGNEDRLGLSACGYVNACVELCEQAAGQSVVIDEIWVCSSDTTQAGIVTALKWLGLPIRVVGLPAIPHPIAPGGGFSDSIAAIGNECADLLDLPIRIEPSDITIVTDYVGSGYAILTKEGLEAMELLAEMEGILLDPVYTSKAMAGLIDAIARNGINARNVVFWHTGGVPALFAYAPSLGLARKLVAPAK